MSRLARLVVVLGLVVQVNAAAGRVGHEGRLLVDVLHELRADGLQLIYSSAVVDGTLRVTVEPTASDPVEALRQILSPLGLDVRDGPGGAVVIVPRSVLLGTIQGRVSAAASGLPLPGVTVRIEPRAMTTRSGPGGEFELRGLARGHHELTLVADGFWPRTVQVVLSGSASTVSVALVERPGFAADVVVTPGRHAVLREPTARRAIGADQMVLAPSVGGDLSRVLGQLPGVTSPDNSAAFHVRGSLAADTSLVLDGLELYDPFHLQGLQSPYDVIDTQVVDRMELLGGGFTADYGDRHGAFVEISTLEPQGQRQGEIEIGTLNSRVSYRVPMGRGRPFSWLVSLRGWYSEAAIDSIELSKGERLDPRFADAYTKLTWALTPRDLLSLHGLFGYDDLDFEETDPAGRERVDITTFSSYLWLRFKRSWSQEVASETVLSGGRIDRSRRGVAQPDDDLIEVNDDRSVDFVGLTHDLAWTLGDRHSVKAGLYARQLQADYLYSSDVIGGASTDVSLEPTGTSLGAYLAYRRELWPTLTTEIGLRWDRQDYTGDDQVSPRFNLLWRPAEATELQFAIGRVQQSQRIHELLVEDGERSFARAEAAEQAEVTLQHRLSGALRLRMDAYFRRLLRLRPRYENQFEPIELFPESAVDRVRLAPERARLRGLELGLRGDPAGPLTWWASYVLSSADDVIEGAHVARSWDQTHAGKLWLGYKARSWFVSVGGVLRSGWPTTPVTAVARREADGSLTIEETLGARNSAHFPAYARLDLRLRRSFEVGDGRLSMTLDVRNLTNRANACCVGNILFDVQPDDTVVPRPELEHWLGITPSLSLLWEF